ncbi:protein kinase domain-containing protein [Gordonia lacunae]|uniref:non-specific serine/threonine protein kinase n=1 Tax=Gordonia lacunae TaxID=417102 RepID=A0A243Q6F1_9ACTN|nr:protein kinase [Gordonia lacunae]OUC76550.1 serine/threonine protein kinase [Gordonia lacunae]
MYQVGDLIAGYRVLGVLGRGGMGEVYQAAHPRLPRADALKVLRSVHATDPVFRARFEREADIVAPLHHPNIVAVYDRGVFDELLWIAMEYVPGTDAARMLARESPLDPGLACTIIAGAAAGLDAAHRRGVMHRDIKPANILITPGEVRDDGGVSGPEAVKLTDFGIAQVLDEVTHLTGTGITIGTMRYASPEQIEGLRVDGRSDIYSLAATAYELLTGAPPFDSPSLHGLMTAHMHHEPPSASARNRALPAAVDRVLARAIAKEPGRRHPTAGEFAAALADVFDSRATLVGPVISPESREALAPPGADMSLPVGSGHAGTGVGVGAGPVPGDPGPRRPEHAPPARIPPEPLPAWPGDDGATQPNPVRGPRHLIVIGIVAVLVAGILGAGAGLVRMSATSVATPDPPDAEVTTTAVELRWNSVAGATGYVVTQNDAVIYSGPDTEFTAPRPVPGTYTYQVAAHDDGRVSDFSRNSEQVDVFMTWGQLQPVADLYHDLIPATPLSTNGFDAMRCWGEDGDLAFSSSKRTVSCTREADTASGNGSAGSSVPQVAAYQVIVDSYDTPDEATAAAKVTAHDLRGVDYTTAQGHPGTLYLSDKQGGQGQAILTFDEGDHARSVVWVVVPGEPAAAAGDVLKRLPI